MKRILLTVVLLLASSAWAAEPIDTKPWLRPLAGEGQVSCGSFMQFKSANNSGQLDLIVQWVWGYMTAHSIKSTFVKDQKDWKRPVGGEISAIPDSPTILLFLEKNCREYPLDSAMDGTNRLIKELGGDIIIRKR